MEYMGNNGVTLRDIWQLQVGQSEAISRIEGAVTQLNGRMQNLEADVVLIRQAHQDSGTKLALLERECLARGKRISEMAGRLNIAEDTGVMHITEERARWKTLRVIGAVLLGLAALVGPSMAVVQCNSHRAASAAGKR